MLRFLLGLCLLILSSNAWALTDAVKKLIQFETQYNAVSKRSDKPIKLPHFEVPLKLVSKDFSSRLDPNIYQSLIFEKNGELYIRWILNPEDTHWKFQLKEHFFRQGLELTEKFYFSGYQTASRSYIAEDPKTKTQFSVKSSTNVTGGIWSDKVQPLNDAIDGRLVSDFLFEQNKLRPFKYVVFMDEPAIYGINGADQAVVIRDLADLKNDKNKKYYLPGFSALHETAGKEIALHNGSSNPQLFWTEHYIKAMGRAMGELAARTGLQMDSPHSQNFLIELDFNFKPTGRIVVRDMADFRIFHDFVKLSPKLGKRLINKFSSRKNIIHGLVASFGPLHGNSSPSWVSDSDYRIWESLFLKEFNSSFAKITKTPANKTSFTKTFYEVKSYFGAVLRPQKSEDFEIYFENMRENGFVKENYVFRCQRLFAN